MLYLTRRPDTGAALQDYFKTAGPIARKLKYTPQWSYHAWQVNRHRETYTLMWLLLALGQEGSQIVTVPTGVYSLNYQTCKDRRMDIWSSFNMTQYELNEDVVLTMDKAKHYMLTAYWLEDASTLDAFEASFIEALQATSGTSKMLLTGGRSPFGYAFTPDLVVISEWDNILDQAKFVDASKRLNTLGVSHVNQFPVAAP